MRAAFGRPVTYMITPGGTARNNFSEKRAELIQQIESAVEAGISLIQIREKALDTRSLFALVREAANITRPTATKLLVNDRVDLAVSARADGVHLTAHSMPPADVRRTFGPDLLIAVSTHTIGEARSAASGGADLIVYGPVFQSPGKGQPTGTESLREVCRSVDIPVIGLGGIDAGNLGEVLEAGAAGVAGIRCFSEPAGMQVIIRAAAMIV